MLCTWPTETQRYDHHQRGFTEVFGYGELFSCSRGTYVILAGLRHTTAAAAAAAAPDVFVILQ